MSFDAYQKLTKNGERTEMHAEDRGTFESFAGEDNDILNAEFNSTEPYEEQIEMRTVAAREPIFSAYEGGIPNRQTGLPIRLEDIRLEDLPI